MRAIRTVLFLTVWFLLPLVVSADTTAADPPGPSPVTDRSPHDVTAASVFSPRYMVGRRKTALGAIDELRSAVPFYSLKLATWSTGVRAEIELSLVSEYDRDDALNVPWGPPGNRIAAENNNVRLGFLDLPTRFGSVRLGRAPVSLGPSALSNLHISRSIPFVDGVTVTVPMGRWTLTQVVATLENRRGIGDLSIDFAYDGYNFGTNVILLSGRRFAWSFDRGEVGIGAQTIFSRKYNAFQIGDVLPVFSVHNAGVGNNNLFISFDGSMPVVPGHRVYAIVGLDDIDGNPIGIADDDVVPTIWAFIAGASGEFDARAVRMTYDAEVVATHYLWGSFEDDHALSRSIYRLRADAGYLVVPLTSPFGPGRVSFEARVAADFRSRVRVGLDLLAIAGDPSVNLVDVPYRRRPVDYRPLLLRADLTVGREVLTGRAGSVGLHVAPGFDLDASGFHPRFAVGGVWRAELRFGDAE